MADQTVAASSPAEVSDVFNGENVSLAEFNRYRQDGELPDRFKPEPAESAPADAPEETAETEGDEPETAPAAEPEDAQEQTKGSGAEKRIKQLLAKTKELERALAAKKDAVPDSSPAQPQQSPQNPRTYQEYRQAFKPSKFLEEYAKANPAAEYEDATAAMADHLSDAREHFRSIEQAEQAKMSALRAKLEDARTRYTNADDTIFPAALAIRDAQIPQSVKDVFAESEHFVDLCYVVGEDPDELKKFISLAQTNAGAAKRQVFAYERGIAEELAKPKDGKFKTPEKKQTTAPKPAATVNSGTARGSFDVNDESLPNDEWMRKRNKQVATRG